MTHAPHRSFFCSNCFLLFLHAGFFVMFPLTQFGQYSRLLTELFEASNSTLDGFVFSNSNSGHKSNSPPITSGHRFFRALDCSSFAVQVKQFTLKMKRLELLNDSRERLAKKL
jgi:hypothetical protein